MKCVQVSGRSSPVPGAIGEVERETAAWVHWYNTRRPHLALGGITPQQAENQHTTTRKEAASTSLHKTQDLAVLTLQYAAKPYWWRGGQPA